MKEFQLETNKERRTLNDMLSPCGHCNNDLKSIDVQSALKEFIDSFLSNYPKSQIIKKAREIFGDEFIEAESEQKEEKGRRKSKMVEHNRVTAGDLRHSLKSVTDDYEIYIEDIKTHKIITSVIIKARPVVNDRELVTLSALVG